MFTQLAGSFSAVLLLFMLMAVGYILGKLGWMGPAEKKFLSRYLINVAVPFNCLRGIVRNLQPENLRESLGFLGLVVLTNLINILIGLAAARLLRLPKKQSGVFAAMAALPNTMYIGLPLITQLFGEAGVPYMMLFYLGTSLYTQSVAVMLVESSGRESVTRRSPLQLVRAILTKPPIIGLICGYLCVFLKVTPPEIVMTFSSYMSQTVSPLAMIFCGYIMYELGICNIRPEGGMPVMLLLRLVVSPLVCFGVCAAVGMTGLSRQVFIMMGALPVVTQIPVMAGTYGADEKYATSGAVVSYLLMFLTVPVIMTLVSTLA